MRDLTPSQAASFKSDVLTIATLVNIKANDGSMIYLTDHDQDLGQYVAQYGLDLSAILMQLGGSGQTATVTMLPDRGIGNGVTYPKVESGMLDAAGVQVFWADYTKSPLEPILITTGFISEAKYGDSSLIELTINTLLAVPRPLCGNVMSQTCRADFGDALCKVDIAPLVDGPRAFAPLDEMSFVMSRDEVTPPGYYNNGTLAFQTGQNKGLNYEVLTVSAADANGRETIYTKVPIAFDVTPGDHFLLYPGCDKIITSGCTYWNNTANFQGEPFIADQSDILPPQSAATVKSTGINTGLPAPCNWWLSQYIKIGFGLNVLFTPGTRAADNVKNVSGGKAGNGSYSVNFFNGYMIPQDAYTAIYNLVGAGDKVAAYDGSLTPLDPVAVTNLQAAGFQVPLNLNINDVLVLDPTYTTQVEHTYLLQFFVVGSQGILDAAKAIGIDPGDITPTPQATVIGGNA